MGKRGRACVVVLGDLGRSPRMQYHALSLARQASFQVDIVAYGECIVIICSKSPIDPHPYHGAATIPSALYPVTLLLKAFIQLTMLLWFLFVKVPAPDTFLVQNPPSVPTLIAVKWASSWRRAAFVVDWHNFGYTLLALSLGRNNMFVSLYRWGKMATGSLKAMQHELDQNWGVRAQVLYDQPPEFFHPALLEERHELFCRVKNDLCHPISRELENQELNETLFTTKIYTDISLKQNRPALVLSSTSWTPDENFGILLEAAVMYDRRVAARSKHLYPNLLFIITGKGPEKEMYEENIKCLNLRHVAFRTMWLPAEDYPLLLGSADLGVCLHTSSSGLDLPMKVVDMFGCGLPVCSVSYSCIQELVKDGKNGLLFSSSSELADQLLILFKGFPGNCDALMSLKVGAMETGSSGRWATEWEDCAKPLITQENPSALSVVSQIADS
ncbi:glycosyl transferase family 1 protein [Arabidopsis lyrata subsp. lyrata]|uniref:Beta-1,4-mannosyltransferase n=1 Tax=Arabidopsis lyrata subsp. lyrata TaxID=81972 RepID=D7M450_ARALL|nr:glycosyl transferase family 1 protein [Arabidopsis lyrata subsp. lyrata]